MSLGENIKKKRKSLKFSQEYIAEQLNLSRQAISKWETNQSEPSTSNLLKLANLFDCDIKDIISPEKYFKEQKSKENENEQTQRNKKMHLAAFFGRLFFLMAYLGSLGAYTEQPDSAPLWFWKVIFLIAVGSTFFATRDYFHEKKGSKRIIPIDLLFIGSFFLYYIFPFEQAINALLTLTYGSILLLILNIHFFIPVWRR
ncbi:helix-turn-helix domain-containing protein [Amphibacillus sp. Q70]|uniref:helix-turn-helix domain-containing protein n=1 Tax=Amphibacillus sp. Q70 TaxID=3453416 RepID=UPI003F863640